MSEQNEVTSLLNRASYLYLRQISEPGDNSLRIVVEEALEDRSEGRVAPSAESPLAEISKDAWPVKATQKSNVFELYWTRYIAYLVTEEISGSSASYEDETYSGNLLRQYKKSHFLEHVLRDTGAHAEPILHYKLICLNHLIDVASYRPPKMRLLTGASSERASCQA